LGIDFAYKIEQRSTSKHRGAMTFEGPGCRGASRPAGYTKAENQ